MYKILVIILTLAFAPIAEGSSFRCHLALANLPRLSSLLHALETDKQSAGDTSPFIKLHQDALVELRSEPHNFANHVNLLISFLEESPEGEFWIRRHLDTLAMELLMNNEQVAAEILQEPDFLRIRYRKAHAGLETGGIISTNIPELLKADNEFIRGTKAKTFVDVGSGHGIPALVLGRNHPEMQFTGYDLVRAKVNGANATAAKLSLTNAHFVEQDLSAPDFHLPEADIYYFYKPATSEIIERMARQIQEIAKHKKVLVLSSFADHYFTRIGCRMRSAAGRSISAFDCG